MEVQVGEAMKAARQTADDFSPLAESGVGQPSFAPSSISAATANQDENQTNRTEKHFQCPQDGAEDRVACSL